MINAISCGTCKNNPENKNRNHEKCEPCLNEWIKTDGQHFPNWEDNLKLYTKGVKHAENKKKHREKDLKNLMGRNN